MSMNRKISPLSPCRKKNIYYYKQKGRMVVLLTVIIFHGEFDGRFFHFKDRPGTDKTSML